MGLYAPSSITDLWLDAASLLGPRSISSKSFLFNDVKSCAIDSVAQHWKPRGLVFPVGTCQNSKWYYFQYMEDASSIIKHLGFYDLRRRITCNLCAFCHGHPSSLTTILLNIFQSSSLMKFLVCFMYLL